MNNIFMTCKDALTMLVLLLKASPDDSNFKNSLDAIQHLHERFSQWCGNLGALASPEHHASLQQRLSNAPMVQDFIVSMTKDLAQSTDDVTAIVLGTRPNRSTAGTSDREMMAQLGLSDSEDDDDFEEEPTSELSELIKAMASSITHLFEASVYVRSFAPKSRRSRAMRLEPFDSKADVLRILDRFPKLRSNQALAQRLGAANARRRQYFVYCRDHHHKLLDETSSKDTQTEATSFRAKDVAGIAEVLDQPALMSEASSTTTVSDPARDELEYPPVPYRGLEEKFLCPYCWDPIGYSGVEQQWRRHVISDLEPYICLYPQCGIDSYKSQHAWFDHELQGHRKQWLCPKCTVLPFESAQSLTQHMGRAHAGSMTQAQLSMTRHQTERPIDLSTDTDCPFCDAFLPDESGKTGFNLQGFRRHVGHHFKQVALFTLPKLNADVDEGLEDESEKYGIPMEDLHVDDEDEDVLQIDQEVCHGSVHSNESKADEDTRRLDTQNSEPEASDPRQLVADLSTPELPTTSETQQQINMELEDSEVTERRIRRASLTLWQGEQEHQDEDEDDDEDEDEDEDNEYHLALDNSLFSDEDQAIEREERDSDLFVCPHEGCPSPLFQTALDLWEHSRTEHTVNQPT